MDDLVLKSIRDGTQYEELPDRVQQALSFKGWQERVKAVCIHQGLPWSGSLATSACHEFEYYEQLLKTYKTKQRVFPYHMAHEVCGKLRVTPFKYYFDVLFQAMRNELPYDQIPNFAAADILRLIGIGRNEYIAKLNACNEKKLLWRVNKSIAKEHLPTEPMDVKMVGWWRVHNVSLSEKDLKEITPEEDRLLRKVSSNKDGVAIADLNENVIHSLYKRHLIYVTVPVLGHQHFSTTSLEGFVSNKDMVAGDADPMESLLYEVFVSNSERLSVDALAQVLGRPTQQIQHAISVACRLGFSSLITSDDLASISFMNPQEPNLSMMGGASSFAAHISPEQTAIAIVLDAEATSYLMMGSLSPGMKRHSVTLFEGGRLAGPQTIEDMRRELWNSVEAVSAFGAEMEGLPEVLSGLAKIVDKLCEVGQPVEIIRKESLSALAVRAASRMLQMAYTAIVAIEPLRLPALPLPVAHGKGPAFYGATAPMLTPWLTLAMLTELQAGPMCIAFTHGQRVTAIPPMAHGCTHAFLWPWEPEKWPGKDMGNQPVPHLVENTFLLYVLNGLLSCTAVLVQPLWSPHGSVAKPKQQVPASVRAASRGQGNTKAPATTTLEWEAPVSIGLVPLPLQLADDREKRNGTVVHCKGMWHGTEDEASIAVPSKLPSALAALGLEKAVGYLWMVPKDVCQVPAVGVYVPEDEKSASAVYVPYTISLGVPLYNSRLCTMVCTHMGEADLLSKDGIDSQATAQLKALQAMATLISSSAANQAAGGKKSASTIITAEALERHQVLLPTQRLLFDGRSIASVEGWACTQGTAVVPRIL